MRKAVNGDECGAAKIGLFINDVKTKIVTLNLEDHLQSRSGEAIKNVEDFIYIGSWIDETERDIKVRKGKTWAALYRLKNIWKAKLSKKLRIVNNFDFQPDYRMFSTFSGVYPVWWKSS